MVINTHHVIARLCKARTILLIRPARQGALLRSPEPAHIVFGALAAIRATERSALRLLLLVKEISFVHKLECNNSLSLAFHLVQVRFTLLSLPVMDDYAKSYQGAKEHRKICDDEDPIAHKPTVNEKAKGCCHLAYEKPFRDVLAFALAPLLVNLLRYGQHKYERA